MWWTAESTTLTYETIGLTLGLLFLFAPGSFWCWACDLIDAYPEAFGFTDQRNADARRKARCGGEGSARGR
jgi:hypothetical protein